MLRRTADYSLPRETPLYGVIALFALLAAVSIWRDRHTIWPTAPTLEETS